MKKQIAMLLLLFSILSCSNQESTPQISGSWYTCSDKGDYFEMHIVDNKYKYSTGTGFASQWNVFEIKGDTIFQSDNQTFKDSVAVYSAKFNFPNSQKLEVDYLTSDESWVFNKLGTKITNTDNNEQLGEDTKQRAIDKKCVAK